ncbi:hypothetical protein DPMN_128625 [Dreissena polymorpha]|uniref:Uncharacterized protein n=1 Tax=Dreissena polymorpha TaxID=45954 RepID=A0A9D4JVX9_DREPO|nr:hypothetical protein DPMN_128625 [Dreissena polymorpha]
MGSIIVLLFAACLSSVNGNYQYVLAPNVIRLENEETLLVGIFGNGRNQTVTVYFEYLNERISRKETMIVDAGKIVCKPYIFFFVPNPIALIIYSSC